LGKTIEMTRVEQEEIPFDNFDKNQMGSSTIVDFIDTQNLRGEPLVMTQHEEHSKVHEHEEYDIHSVYYESYFKSPLKAQVGALVEGVEHPFLVPPAIDEVQVDTEASSGAITLLDDSH